MELVGQIIKRQSVSNLTADREEFRRIFNDMCQFGGSFIPTPAWLLCKLPDQIGNDDLSQVIDIAGSEEVFQNEFAALEQRVAGWVGNAHKLTDEVVARDVSNYANLLKDSDPLGLWRANVDDMQVADSMMVADLGSIMDLNFLYSFSFNPDRKVTKILEVGGGYGRLAEAALNVFGKSIRYVLVDSVPVSLYYAKEYMERACPDIRVGSYYNGDAFDLNIFDCYIIPSWYFQKLNQEKYDMCVNIESFQEMNQEHVDSYLNLFDSVSVDDATIYISNAHDYLFQGNWHYPNHWRKLVCTNTPRSWTADHPTEIFEKSKGDFSSANARLDDVYNFWRLKESAPMSTGPSLGDQIEAVAGKRVRAALRSGASHFRSVLDTSGALRRKSGK
jgi:L-rhamnose mutarotase